MDNFPGRKFLNIVLQRRTKVSLIRTYMYLMNAYNNVRYVPIRYCYPNLLSYPKFLSIFLTTRCNLRCTICDRTNFKTSDMDFEDIYKLRNPIRHAKTIDLTGWGEAILYPQYEDVIKYILSINNKKKLIYQTTNGTSDRYGDLLRGRLQGLVISLNAATPDTYEREMKGGNFEKTISSVKSLLSKLTEDDRKAVILHFVAHKNNYKELPKFIELAKSLHVTQVTIGHFLANGSNTESNTVICIQNDYNDILEKVEEASKELGIEVFYRKFGENYELSPKNCAYPYRSCFVMTDGEVTPCCSLGDKTFGNAFKNSFESVWFGKMLQMLRKSRNLPECSVCSVFQSFDKFETHLTPRYNQERFIKK